MSKYSIGIICYFLVASFAMWFVGPIRDNPSVINYLYMSFTGLSAVAGVVALKTVGIHGERARAVFTSVIATLAWFIAELIATIETTINNGQISFPSYGDPFFLIGYILFFVYLILEIRLANMTMRSINKRVIIASLLFALVAIVSFFLFTSSLTYSGESTFWENVVTIGYGVGDVILIITSVFLIQFIWIYRGGKMAKTWHYLLIGFILITVADYLYGIYINQYEANLNPITNIVNTIYIAGYGSIALYYIELHTTMKQIQQKVLSKLKK